MSALTQMESLEHVAEQQNHYAVHLCDVSKTSDVLATHDIYNENGLLIARKGVLVDNHTADLIVQHTLLHPLEEQVNIENSLDGRKINEGIKSLMDKYPDIGQIHSANEFQKTLDGLLEGGILHSILLQELTVMNERLPDLYEKTLFCAWLSALIAWKMGLTENVVRSSLIAGLAHDIGLLHISPEIIKKQGALSPDEWRTIRCHVIIGQLMLKKLYPNDSTAAKAVLEHHERCDGSGYPLGKTAEYLDVPGQIVGISDSIQAIRTNVFPKCGRSLGDVIPYLKMNKFNYLLNIHYAARSVIQKAGLKPSKVNPLGSMDSLLSYLLFNGKQMQDSVGALKQILEHSGSFMKIRSCRKLVMVVRPVVLMIESSGLVKAELLEWIETLQNEADEIVMDDLLEMGLMQNELYWQLTMVCNVINDALEKDRAVIEPEDRQYLEHTHTRINEIVSRVAERMKAIPERQ